MKTVAVIEGFAGGPMHTRQFRKALSQAGFNVIKDRKKADIIIAHSAGIYGIPLDAKAKLLILIGPTYWPGQKLIKRVVRHTRTSGRYHVANFGWRYYLWKKLLEFYYFFRRHTYMWLGILNNNRLDHLGALIKQNGRITIIIRNQEDPFSSPDLKKSIKGGDLKFIDLPGVHDDYVTNPKPYIDLILKEI
jgi:hypothetical protein